MATKYTNIETALTNPKDRYDGKIRSGKIQMTRATYTADGTEANTDTLQIVTLPVGAAVLPHLSQVFVSGTGITWTGAIGDAGDDNRYMLSTDIKAGGTFGFAQDALSLAASPAGLTPHYLRSGSNVVQMLMSAWSTNTGATSAIFDIAWVHGGTNPTE